MRKSIHGFIMQMEFETLTLPSVGYLTRDQVGLNYSHVRWRPLQTLLHWVVVSLKENAAHARCLADGSSSDLSAQEGQS